MRILALDLATKTGWATNTPEASGVDTFDVRRGESPGTRYLRFVAWLREKITIIQPELIVFEKAHHRGGAATEIAAGFATHLQSTCAAMNIEHAAIHTATIKKHATGKGNAGKSEVMAAYQEKWGKAPIDDNEADARWLLDYAVKSY
jgi:Holliday junction resolvasome RuvABC endonuclease subunit